MSSQSIFYKFKSARDYDTIDLDGPFMLCSKLKQAIMLQNNLAKSVDIDLRIEDVQTGREYYDNSKIYPNTSVLVSRVPISRGNVPVQKSITSKVSKPTTTSIPGLSSIPGLEPKSQDGFGDDIFSGVQAPQQQTEEDRLAALINSRNTEYAPERPSNQLYKNGSSKVPPGYICHRCGEPGHLIRDCPKNGDPSYNIKKVKRATGIPTSFLQKVDPSLAGEKGTMVLPGGQVAIMKPNEAGFTKEVESSTQIVEIPSTLKCPLCKGLFKEAVLTPCCGRSFCETCITTHLLEKSKSTCPSCQKKLSVKSLVPNVSLNENAQAFRTRNPNVSEEREEVNVSKSPKYEEPTKEELQAKERKENEIRIKKRFENEINVDRKRKENFVKGDRVHRDRRSKDDLQSSPRGKRDRQEKDAMNRRSMEDPERRDEKIVHSPPRRDWRGDRSQRERRGRYSRQNTSPPYDSRPPRDYRDSRGYRDREYRDERNDREPRSFRDERDFRSDRDYREFRNARDYRDDRFERDYRDDREYDYRAERDRRLSPVRGDIQSPMRDERRDFVRDDRDLSYNEDRRMSPRPLSPLSPRDSRDRAYSPPRGKHPREIIVERDLETRIINKEKPLRAVGVYQGRKNFNLSELEHNRKAKEKGRGRKSRRR